MKDLDQDLRERWLPSAEQMALADVVLEAGDFMTRPEGEKGVYTAHLLLNKEYGFWTADVELVFLDGVFLTRKAVLQYVHNIAKERYAKDGVKLVGGWAWHPRVGEAAVWEDIVSEFPGRDQQPREQKESDGN